MVRVILTFLEAKMGPTNYNQPVKRSFLSDSRGDKILIIGTGVLTAFILVTLYLLTQRTLTALTVPQRSAEFVIEIKHGQNLLAQEAQNIRQTSCSGCHAYKSRAAKGALTLMVNRRLQGAEAGPTPPEYLRVDY
jgi:hypothetical protein